MEAPDLVRFADRLAEAQQTAVARGELGRREYDALLVDPDFEDEAFEAGADRSEAATKRIDARLSNCGLRLGRL